MNFEDLTTAKALPDQTLYSPKEAAVLLGVTQGTITTWCRNGRLDGLKAGKHWKFVTRQSLKAFVEGGDVCEVTSIPEPFKAPAVPIPAQGWELLASNLFEQNALCERLHFNQQMCRLRAGRLMDRWRSSMTNRRKDPSTEDLDSLRQRIIAWRRDRSGHGPMPPELWDSAAALARMYGVCRIACAVGLDYKSLRAKVAKSMERPGLVKPTFVQLPATMIQAEMAPIPAPGAVIEISAPDGARLQWPHGRHL